MQEDFVVLRKYLEDIQVLLDTMHAADPLKLGPRATSLKDALFCIELAMMFYEEANLALQAGAWFAASSLASSALESLLLSKCFLCEEEIKGITRFQTLKKSWRKDFGLFARSQDLGKLLEIANELSWFPDTGLPKAFKDHISHHLDENALASLNALFENDPNVGRNCAAEVKYYRNLLHPAVCLKEMRKPSREAGLTATLLFMIAFSSLARV